MAKRLGVILQKIKNHQKIQNANFSKNKNRNIIHYANLEISRGK
jgi:hypothetical protein